MMKDCCVILAAGDFPKAEQPLQVLRDAGYVCCCDSAAVSLLEWGRMPDAIVGDGDSLPVEFKKQYEGIIHEVSEQEYNDLTKATKYCMSQGYKDIVYLGASGRREDHTMGNVSLMSFYKREFGLNVRMMTDYGTFIPASGNQTFESFPHQQVSIFIQGNKSGATEMASEGLKWNSYPYQELWQGTLNEAVGDSFTLIANGEYIVYQTYDAKI